MKKKGENDSCLLRNCVKNAENCTDCHLFCNEKEKYGRTKTAHDIPDL